VNINERKLLPLLFNAYEFGSSGSAVLPTLFKLGKRLSDSDYKKRIVPIITKLFASTDRMTRFRLLQQVNQFRMIEIFLNIIFVFVVRYLCRTFNRGCC
jgi:SCY1-like protein 1